MPGMANRDSADSADSHLPRLSPCLAGRAYGAGRVWEWLWRRREV